MTPSDPPPAGPPSPAVTLDDIRRQWASAVDEGARENASIRSYDLQSPRTRAEAAGAPEPATPQRIVSAGTDGAASGDFIVGRLLGKGGMGMVFRAEQAGLDRSVALKTIHAEYAARPDARRKFLSEARVTGRLDHPNIVPVHELASDSDGALFYTMKVVRGVSWAEALPKRTEAENLDILLKVADAVAFAHGRGVIHRDLKPENVMLGDYGEVLVMDWGLAVGVGVGEGADADERLTPANARGGTPAYMAPEMAAADAARIGPASDVYLLGAILYEILTGLRPHHGESVFGCLFSARTNAIQPSDRRDELAAIARQALSTDPAERPRDVKAFQEAIRECREHTASLALTRDARDTLAQAKRSGDYTAHARAVFGFGEALRLWPENHAADMGLTLSRRAYAETALQRGDFDLALSQTEHMGASDAADLAGRAEAGKAERERRRLRLRRLTWLTAGLCALLVTVGGVAYWRVARAERRRVAALEAEHAARAEQKRLARELALAAHRLNLWEESETTRTAPADKVPTAGSGAALTAAVTELAPWPEELRKRTKVLTSLSLLAGRADEFAALREAFLRLAGAAEQAGDDGLAANLKTMAQLLEIRRSRAPRESPADDGAPSDEASQHSELIALAQQARETAEREAREKAEREATKIDTPQKLHAALAAANPGYQNDARITVENNRIVGVEIDYFWRPYAAHRLGDLTPLRGLPLRNLRVRTPFPPGNMEEDRMDLSILAGMPLTNLSLGYYHYVNMESLRELPIEELALFGRRVDLTPLAGKPVKSLSIHPERTKGLDKLPVEVFYLNYAESDNHRHRPPTFDLKSLNTTILRRLSLRWHFITDLRPLKGVPLVFLDITNNKVADLSPLAGMPLETLYCDGNEITDLSPLRGMPLKTLHAARNRITDLSPLRELPLETLRCAVNDIADLSPLSGKTFRELDIWHNPSRSYEPLANLSVERLRFDADGGLPGLATVRANPRIKKLSLHRPYSHSLSFSPGEELDLLRQDQTFLDAPRFWAEFDKGGATAYLKARRAFEAANPAFRQNWRHNLRFAPIWRDGRLHGLDIMGPIIDFSPLAGLGLRELVLKDLPIKEARGSFSINLSGLKGLDLEVIDLSRSAIGDISALAGLKAKSLDLRDSRVTDFSPLATCELDDLFVDNADAAARLSGAKGIKRINGKPNPDATAP